MKDRYSEMRALCEVLDVDALALVTNANFARLFGKKFMSHERPLVVMIPKSGAPLAIVPELELTSFAAIEFEGRAFSWRDQSGYQSAFQDLAEALPARRIAVEGQSMRVFISQALEKAYGKIELVDGEAVISALRIVKTGNEIAKLQRAIEISETALAELLSTIRIGQSEREVAAKLISLLFHHGSEGLAFSPIVAFGAHAAMPHARPSDLKLQAGDVVLIDVGGQYGGLNADITRSFFSGEPSARHAAIYETVLRANQAAFEATRAGVSAHAIDDAATNVLEASDFAAGILTKTGHGLGREVHEQPYIMRGNHQVLPEGAIYTNEPGLYLPNEIGVRIEDVVLVTGSGAQNLTRFARELTVIG